MLVKELCHIMLAEVKIVSEKKNGGYIIHYDGDLFDPNMDPEVKEREVEVIQAVRMGRIRIIVK